MIWSRKGTTFKRVNKYCWYISRVQRIWICLPYIFLFMYMFGLNKSCSYGDLSKPINYQTNYRQFPVHGSFKYIFRIIHCICLQTSKFTIFQFCFKNRLYWAKSPTVYAIFLGVHTCAPFKTPKINIPTHNHHLWVFNFLRTKTPAFVFADLLCGIRKIL